MSSSVILGGARTPIGRLLGSLKGLTAADLGAIAMGAALDRSNVAADEVQYVILGQVVQAGSGQLIARQAAVAAGVPMSVPAVTVNKVCLSGLNSVAMADQLIRAGDYDTILAGGTESMTRAPHVLLSSRTGTKYGATELVDSMELDALWDVYTNQSMGMLTEAHNTVLGITRSEQDLYAARSHRLAALASKNGLLAEEIVPVSLAEGRATRTLLDDEGIRSDTSVESLARLRGAFAPDGGITAGSSSQISDGAAAVVVMAKEKAQALGLSWIAEIEGHASVAGPDSTLQSQPARAIAATCAKRGVQPRDLDLVEINEAFACVAIQSMRELDLCEERVNVNGGAIALGHPVGMSGTRLVLHLALELSRRGGGLGAAALCGGGGQGECLLVRAPGLG